MTQPLHPRHELSRQDSGSQIDPRHVAICTVHGYAPAGHDADLARRCPWPMLQLRQLRRCTPKGFTVYAYGNQLMGDHDEDYLRSCDDVVFFSSRDVMHGTHTHVWPIRNWLTRQAAKDHEWIVHLDSDAFPIAPDWLSRYCSIVSPECPVVAVQRNNHGHHSDRCFLMFSRAGFRAHAFDFSKVGVAEAGAGISGGLEDMGLSWHPLIRTNAFSYHQRIAGIYDDRIYHHAAGSRRPRFHLNRQVMEADADEARTEVLTHRILREWLFNETDSFIRQLRGQEPPRLLNDALAQARLERSAAPHDGSR